MLACVLPVVQSTAYKQHESKIRPFEIFRVKGREIDTCTTRYSRHLNLCKYVSKQALRFPFALLKKKKKKVALSISLHTLIYVTLK